MLPLVVATYQQSVSQCEATTPPAWIMQPPRLADTAERMSHPQREADHYANNWKELQKYINEQVDRVAHIDGQLMQLL